MQKIITRLRKIAAAPLRLVSWLLIRSAFKLFRKAYDYRQRVYGLRNLARAYDFQGSDLKALCSITGEADCYEARAIAIQKVGRLFEQCSMRLDAIADRVEFHKRRVVK